MKLLSVGCAPRKSSLSLFALDNGTAASLQITSRTVTPSKWSVAQPNIMIGIWAIVALSFTASPCHAAVHSAAFVSSIGSQLSHQRSITGCASSGHRREISSEGYRATNLQLSKDDDTFLIDADVIINAGRDLGDEIMKELNGEGDVADELILERGDDEDEDEDEETKHDKAMMRQAIMMVQSSGGERGSHGPFPRPVAGAVLVAKDGRVCQSHLLLCSSYRIASSLTTPLPIFHLQI